MNIEREENRRKVLLMAVRMLICLMLTAALVAPVTAPAEVMAASPSAKTQYLEGMTAVFKTKVITGERLQVAPENLKATGKRKSIKISWSRVPASGISGYIILRKDQSGNTWRQVATVKAKKSSYTDKKAKKKNRFYQYSVVAYKKTGKKYKISAPAASVGALTTRSSKKNVKTVKVTNLANVVSVMKGSCAQTYLKYPDKAYSTAMTWSSSNPSVASVDANGLVTGINPGAATISARSHTGNVSSFTVYVTIPGTAQAMIDTFYAWNGFSRLNGYHSGIIDIYNSITPWPAGYKMKYSDAWCDATVTAAAIKTGNVERIGRECSVPRHIKIFQQLGIWEEDGTIVPRPGDIIVYSWGKMTQPNNASASHIGIVASVSGNQITAIEGNRGIGVVATRTIPVGWGFIRGYARPPYLN